jgi:hypothetical protein
MEEGKREITHVSVKICKFDSLSSKEIDGWSHKGWVIVADVSPTLSEIHEKEKRSKKKGITWSSVRIWITCRDERPEG